MGIDELVPGTAEAFEAFEASEVPSIAPLYKLHKLFILHKKDPRQSGNIPLSGIMLSRIYIALRYHASTSVTAPMKIGSLFSLSIIAKTNGLSRVMLTVSSNTAAASFIITAVTAAALVP